MADDAEDHLAILSTFVRLGILVWSGGILTLNYVTIPNLPQQKIDPTFYRQRLYWGLSNVRGSDGEEI